MPSIVLVLVFVLGAYLLGAVPFGFIIGQMRGVDIRQHGSRNIGATNAGRVLGRRWGILCLVLDILKGLAPTLLFGLFCVPQDPAAGAWLAWLAVGVAAVLGHLYPAYLAFRGGKGVATTIGVALGVFPYFTVAMVVALVAYFAVRLASGKVSLGSLAIAVVFPVAVFTYAVPISGVPLAACWPLVVVAAALGLLIIARHHENIRRLLRGQELNVSTSSAKHEAGTGD